MGNKVKKMLKNGFVSNKEDFKKRWIYVYESWHILDCIEYRVGLFRKNGRNPDENLNKYILAKFNIKDFDSKECLRSYLNNRLEYITEYIKDRNLEYEIIVDKREFDIESIIKDLQHHFLFQGN